MGMTWHARSAVLRSTAAAVGVVLTASGLTAAPAQAGLLDPITGGIGIEVPELPIGGGTGDVLDPVLDPILGPVTPVVDPVTGLVAPVPGIDGIGSIQGPSGYVCTATSDLTAVLQCPPLPLESLSLLEKTVLTAQETAGSGFAFGSWSNCPQPVGAVCTIPAGSLDGTLFSPIADFIPVPGGGEEPGAAPTVSITSWQPGQALTDATDASFQFAMTPVTEGWTLQCQLTAITGGHAWAPCATGKRYADLKPGDYAFSVRATDGAAEPTFSNVVTQRWTIRNTAPASVVVDSGPLHKQWYLQDFAQFTYTVEPADATVVCKLDGRVKECSSTRALLQNLSGRTHTFTVTATDAAGDSDRARRIFTVPKNNNTLRHSKGDWSQLTDRNAFHGTFSETDKRRSFVKAGAKRIKRIALVVTKGPGFGKVKVMLGKKVLERVSLNASKVRTSQLVPIETFRKRQRGVVKVVVTSRNKTVRIEGLGIASR